MREARPITTQNPSVGLYRFATAFPGHRKHVAPQRQSFASAWPGRHTPFRGFQNVREARTLCGPLCHCFPRSSEHAALQRQPFVSAWPCRHILHLEGFNVREARPIATQDPSVGLYRFATAFPGHREHVALQRQPFASAWPGRHTPFRGFQNAREARPIATQNPSVGLLPLCHCLPRSPRTRCPAAAALCQRLASRHTPFRGFQNMREARPITTQNPSVGLYRFATVFPDHREHVALQRLPFASALALPRGNNPFPSLQVHSIASALPSHRPVSLLGLVLPCVSEAPLGSLPCYPPFSFTGPSRWCAMLDVDSSSSPVPAPGQVAILHLEGRQTMVESSAGSSMGHAQDLPALCKGTRWWYV